MVEDPANVARYLAAVGEATEVPPAPRGAAPRTGGPSRGVENAGRASGRRSLRIEPDRGHQASSREGPASPSRARQGW